MKDMTTIGVDLAKNLIQVHGVDQRGGESAEHALRANQERRAASGAGKTREPPEGTRPLSVNQTLMSRFQVTEVSQRKAPRLRDKPWR